MKTHTNTPLPTTVAASVSGEDLACGDFVAVMHVVYELPSYLWDCGGYALSPTELVRLRYTPQDAGQPLRVYAICLPFVYVKNASGVASVLDLRRTHLVRLNRRCAKRVWKELKPAGA